MFELSGNISYDETNTIRFRILTPSDNLFFTEHHSIYESYVYSYSPSDFSDSNIQHTYDPDNKLTANGFKLVKLFFKIPFVEYISITCFNSTECHISIIITSHYQKQLLTLLIITALRGNDVLFDIIKKTCIRELNKNDIYYNIEYRENGYILFSLYFNDNLLKHPMSQIYGMELESKSNAIIIPPRLLNVHTYNIKNIKRKYFSKIRKIFSLQYPIKYINCLYHTIDIFLERDNDIIDSLKHELMYTIFPEYNIHEIQRLNRVL